MSETIGKRVRGEVQLPQLVTIDLSIAPRVALQSAHTLRGLAGDLSAARLRMHFGRTRSAVRERLRHEGLDAQLGGIDGFTSVADVVDNFPKTG